MCVAARRRDRLAASLRPGTMAEPTIVERGPGEHLPSDLDGEQVLAERVVVDRARERERLRDQLVSGHGLVSLARKAIACSRGCSRSDAGAVPIRPPSAARRSARPGG